MKKELEVFENRSDDWLAKQRALEDRTSVWDFDDAKKLKQDHEIKHRIYDKKFSLKNKASIANNTNLNQQEMAKRFAIVIVAMSLMIMLFGFIAMIMGY